MSATNSGKTEIQNAEFKKFAWLRIVGAIAIALAVLWGLTWIINALDLSRARNTAGTSVSSQNHGGQLSSEAANQGEKSAAAAEEASDTHASDDKSPPIHETHGIEKPEETKNDKTRKEYETTGAFFVDSLIEPIDYEVNERFWGWRPNDIINITDNVNELQRGVLEVTRRATVGLTEKISRTGSASALNPLLEDAMNSFMISSESYWMPSAEAEYNKAIANLKTYKKQLIRNEAAFYTRSDSLIPLLQTLEDLLGSCDENLVKQKEDNGEPVSTFQADNYFYYAKGVAMAMTTILHAVDEEFAGLLETRNAKDIMHHAVESTHHAAELDPWLMVTEASLNGILANHRANMAAHISHARYYLGLMVKTLST